MAQSNNLSHIANLGFLLDSYDGMSNDSIEYELFRILFQVTGLTPYDRVNGGNYENIEQQPMNEVVMLLFVKDIIESVYRFNESQEFNPYIVLGFNDIQSKPGEDGKFYTEISYRLLQDLQAKGTINTEDLPL